MDSHSAHTQRHSADPTEEWGQKGQICTQFVNHQSYHTDMKCISLHLLYRYLQHAFAELAWKYLLWGPHEATSHCVNFLRLFSNYYYFYYICPPPPPPHPHLIATYIRGCLCKWPHKLTTNWAFTVWENWVVKLGMIFIWYGNVYTYASHLIIYSYCLVFFCLSVIYIMYSLLSTDASLKWEEERDKDKKKGSVGASHSHYKREKGEKLYYCMGEVTENVKWQRAT